MIDRLRTRVHKQPIIALYFESETVMCGLLLPKLQIWMDSIKLSFKLEEGFCLSNGNQNDRQKSPPPTCTTVVVTPT